MQLAVIGAGVAGLVAARALRQRRPELALAVFEKSRGLGGRVATRRREGFAFDHGAQNLRAPGAAVARLLIEQLDTSLLRAIELPVWVFDRAGAIAPGDPAQNAEPKWCYADGANRLGKLLAEGLDVSPMYLMAFPKKDEYAFIAELVRRLPTTHMKKLRKQLKTWVGEMEKRN